MPFGNLTGLKILPTLKASATSVFRSFWSPPGRSFLRKSGVLQSNSRSRFDACRTALLNKISPLNSPTIRPPENKARSRIVVLPRYPDHASAHLEHHPRNAHEHQHGAPDHKPYFVCIRARWTMVRIFEMSTISVCVSLSMYGL